MIWKPITRFPGYVYRVSDRGDVQRQLPNGKWRTLTPFHGGQKIVESGRAMVKMVRSKGDYVAIPVVDLVMEGFGITRPPGKVVTHKNGQLMDCAIENLCFTTRRAIGKKYGGSTRKAVEKLDARGNVVDIYRSVSDAAEKNFCCRTSIQRRCNGRIKTDLAGFYFRYEGSRRKMKFNQEGEENDE